MWGWDPCRVILRDVLINANHNNNAPTSQLQWMTDGPALVGHGTAGWGGLSSFCNAVGEGGGGEGGGLGGELPASQISPHAAPVK